MLVCFENVTFGYDGVPTVEEASFELHEGERVGFVGGNGEGKTTVLRLLLGELTPDFGRVFRKNGIRIGYLAQSGGFEAQSTVYDAMREVFREDEELLSRLSETQRAMAEADPRELALLSARAESLEKRIAARDSYHFEVRIRTVLGGMGFENMYDRPVSVMSGGEKTRLKLCRLLLEEPDLLVLDEPTNHLDLKTLFWLEEYLLGLKGAMLVVSHDRYFLDRVTGKTVELERGKLSSYKGNYSAYRPQKEERYKERLRAYERQREEIEKLRTYVDKNIVRATTAGSALSRVNRLERMDVLEKPLPPPRPPKFVFTAKERPYEKVLSAENFDLRVDGNVLLRDASLTLLRGEKCALVGDNGTGKSTLVKFLLSGDRHVTLGKFVSPAYYDQENADLDPEERVLDLYRGTDSSQTDARKALARAGLGAEDVEKKVKELSGGMRAKLELAMLQQKHGNFLVLDEPTNHLDLPAREALEEALRAFDGTVLFVSHDRRFIESIATRIVCIEDGVLTAFQGSYAEYLQSRRTPPPPSPERKEKKVEGYRSKEERAREAQRRTRTKEIEAQLEALEREEAALNEELARSAADYSRVREITDRLGKIRETSDALYAEYETLI